MARSTPQNKTPQKKPAGAALKPSRAPRVSGYRPGQPPRPTLSFSRVNAIWLGAAAVVIATGYGLLAGGSMTPAALLLVVGYLVLLPIGIIKR
jgi:hypothetical protein